MLPVIAVVAADRDMGAAVLDVLQRRYGADYQVVDVREAAALPAVLQALAADGRVVALALAPVSGAGDAARYARYATGSRPPARSRSSRWGTPRRRML